MEKLLKLLAEREQKVKSFADLVDKMNADGYGQAAKAEDQEAEDKKAAELVAADKKAYDGLKKEIAALDEKIDRQREADRLKVATADPIDPAGQRTTVPAQVKAAVVPGTGFVRTVIALAATKGIPMLAAQHASKLWGPEGEAISRALAAGTAASGGFLVDDQHSREIIELLRARTVVRRAGARTMDMPGGNMNVPKHVAGSSAGYIGENTNIPAGQPGFGNRKFTARTLASLVPVSNDLIKFASANTEQFVRDDILNSMAVAEDAAFIRDQGLGNAPKGMRYWAATANVIPANATVNLANVTIDLGKAELALMGSNVPLMRPSYVMAPRSLNYLRNLRDTTGVLAFPEINASFQVGDPTRPMANLRGFPVWTTTSIPVNLGGGSDESEVYFGDMSEAIIAEVPGITIDASDTAAYHDGSQVVAAFSQNQTVIRAITQHDFAMRHDVSVAVLTAVKWI